MSDEKKVITFDEALKCIPEGEAVHRMEDAAQRASQAAQQCEDAATRIAHLLEDGYGGNGLRLIEALESAKPVETVDELAWMLKAKQWLMDKAAEQDATNKQCPDHLAAYPSWGERVRWQELLAARIDGEYKKLKGIA